MACNFLEVAEGLEALPISIAAERSLMWRLGQLEVMGRSSRLPRPYARLMATHALGLLRVKFSGVWPRAAAIIGALCQRRDQRELVWEPIRKALRKVMPPPATRHQVAAALHLLPLKGAAVEPTSSGGNEAKPATKHDDAGQITKGHGEDDDGYSDLVSEGAPLSTAPSVEQQETDGLRLAFPLPKPWVPRLLSEAAALDGGPSEEMDLPVALQGVFLDEAVRTGLQPESGEVPLWASTDPDSAFIQVKHFFLFHQTKKVRLQYGHWGCTMYSSMVGRPS